ncbi:MAG: CDP-2,3-bis-(O-geranylgeranyl)-sn-glycerol synthase [Thermoproteota archaeon]|nr:MAG: CDP-2,3-bis-(O-geranylgeranyl)-sn-glycerol synthase [Candidatus Korarchaeota archaeon]
MNNLNSLVFALWYILPAYFANATPVILGGGKPLDLGLKWIDGERIFGDHKTFRGILAGLLVGTVVGTIQGRELLGFFQSLGAMLGDLVSSFLKRRLKRKPGQWTPVLDEEGFVIFSLVLSKQIEPVPTKVILFLLVITPIIHFGTNRLKEKLLIGGNSGESEG